MRWDWFWWNCAQMHRTHWTTPHSLHTVSFHGVCLHLFTHRTVLLPSWHASNAIGQRVCCCSPSTGHGLNSRNAFTIAVWKSHQQTYHHHLTVVGMHLVHQINATHAVIVGENGLWNCDQLLPTWSFPLCSSYLWLGIGGEHSLRPFIFSEHCNHVAILEEMHVSHLHLLCLDSVHLLGPSLLVQTNSGAHVGVSLLKILSQLNWRKEIVEQEMVCFSYKPFCHFHDMVAHPMRHWFSDATKVRCDQEVQHVATVRICSTPSLDAPRIWFTHQHAYRKKT